MSETVFEANVEEQDFSAADQARTSFRANVVERKRLGSNRSVCRNASSMLCAVSSRRICGVEESRWIESWLASLESVFGALKLMLRKRTSVRQTRHAALSFFQAMFGGGRGSGIAGQFVECFVDAFHSCLFNHSQSLLSTR